MSFLRTVVSTSGVDPRLAGGRITVDLEALVENWRHLALLSTTARCGAVVKADAYGCGTGPVVTALVAAGCNLFFVAHPSEGLAVREIAPKAEIIVMNGLFEEAVPTYAESGLIPALSSLEDIELWSGYWKQRGSRRPCALYVDTGMNRMGLSMDDILALTSDQALFLSITPILVMSHLACADEPGHPLNLQQLAIFQKLRTIFPDVEFSLANSAGIFLGADYHFDVTRPGVAIYGGQAASSGHAPSMQPVVRCEARIVRIRQVKRGDSVSYGGTYSFENDATIAVCGCGYADGYPRSLSGSGVKLREVITGGGLGFVAGKTVPLVGRVTMDFIMFDITDVDPTLIHAGDHVELFGPNIPLDEVATRAGTIGYELLTSMGKRYHRRYMHNSPVAGKLS